MTLKFSMKNNSARSRREIIIKMKNVTTLRGLMSSSKKAKDSAIITQGLSEDDVKSLYDYTELIIFQFIGPFSVLYIFDFHLHFQR